MINADKIIKTERLEIRPFGETDRDALAEILSDGTVKKTYMIPDFDTYDGVLKLADRLRALSLDGGHFVRGIYAGGVLAGFVNDVEMSGGTIELGYVIHPGLQNRGYATEMLGAVTDALLSADFTCVTTGAFEENAASIRVMEKCGMMKTGRTEDIEYRGAVHRCVFYVAERG